MVTGSIEQKTFRTTNFETIFYVGETDSFEKNIKLEDSNTDNNGKLFLILQGPQANAEYVGITIRHKNDPYYISWPQQKLVFNIYYPQQITILPVVFEKSQQASNHQPRMELALFFNIHDRGKIYVVDDEGHFSVGSHKADQEIKDNFAQSVAAAPMDLYDILKNIDWRLSQKRNTYPPPISQYFTLRTLSSAAVKKDNGCFKLDRKQSSALPLSNEFAEWQLFTKPHKGGYVSFGPVLVLGNSEDNKYAIVEIDGWISASGLTWDNITEICPSSSMELLLEHPSENVP